MRVAVLLVSAAGLSLGCAAIHPLKPTPPPAPRRVEPAIAESDVSPSNGRGRVILDAEGDRAMVARVLETYDPVRSANLEHGTPLGPERRVEKLCITPCATDLRHGSHQLVFTSMHDELRTSTTHIDVPANGATTIVRHALGTEGFANPRYGGGAFLLFLGIGVTTAGSLLTLGGVAGRPTMQDDGTMFYPRTLLLPGLITLGSGLLVGGIGVVLMSKNRPVIQRGSTTTWTKEPHAD